MDGESAIKLLKEAQLNSDTEQAHCQADTVLCELLTELGYRDVIEEYLKVAKWYA